MLPGTKCLLRGRLARRGLIGQMLPACVRLIGAPRLTAGNQYCGACQCDARAQRSPQSQPLSNLQHVLSLVRLLTGGTRNRMLLHSLSCRTQAWQYVRGSSAALPGTPLAGRTCALTGRRPRALSPLQQAALTPSLPGLLSQPCGARSETSGSARAARPGASQAPAHHRSERANGTGS